ncbi:hypothetical protein BLNAU_19880 [Blattamonas nauphoetae]|uniref:Uncharacterized protein n=1 Tax=Blattamonas nauphoetae TaxID=2049346 RepID=A0ABQ9X3F9_9EUKA|nr:hypothetical protein BLNAU_19880 [Blattamonas nauphoetae]
MILPSSSTTTLNAQNESFLSISSTSFSTITAPEGFIIPAGMQKADALTSSTFREITAFGASTVIDRRQMTSIITAHQSVYQTSNSLPAQTLPSPSNSLTAVQRPSGHTVPIEKRDGWVALYHPSRRDIFSPSGTDTVTCGEMTESCYHLSFVLKQLVCSCHTTIFTTGKWTTHFHNLVVRQHFLDLFLRGSSLSYYHRAVGGGCGIEVKPSELSSIPTPSLRSTTRDSTKHILAAQTERHVTIADTTTIVTSIHNTHSPLTIDGLNRNLLVATWNGKSSNSETDETAIIICTSHMLLKHLQLALMPERLCPDGIFSAVRRSEPCLPPHSTSFLFFVNTSSADSRKMIGGSLPVALPPPRREQGVNGPTTIKVRRNLKMSETVSTQVLLSPSLYHFIDSTAIPVRILLECVVKLEQM